MDINFNVSEAGRGAAHYWASDSKPQTPAEKHWVVFAWTQRSAPPKTKLLRWKQKSLLLRRGYFWGYLDYKSTLKSLNYTQKQASRTAQQWLNIFGIVSWGVEGYFN